MSKQIDLFEFELKKSVLDILKPVPEARPNPQKTEKNKKSEKN